MVRNIDEIKKLAKILLLSRLSSNLLPTGKPKYFNILKVKKIRENSLSQEDNYNQNYSDSLGLCKNESKNDFENFFNYNFSSESDSDSLDDVTQSNHINQEDLVFNSVFNPKFVSVNQFKEDDEEFIDLSNNMMNFPSSNQVQNYFTNQSLRSFSSLNDKTDNSRSDLKPSIFTEDEIKEISQIYEEIKQLNKSINNEEKIQDLLSKFEGDFKKKKYKILTAEEKRKLVELAKESNAKEISKKFGVPLKSLKRWLLLGHERKKGGGRKEKDPEMEALLYEWYTDFHLKNKNHVTSKILKQKALELTKYDDFVASKDWFNKFKKKYNIETIKEAELNRLLK
jgi:transposase-like protein